MSGAEELLNSGASTYLARPETEPHIVVGEDRFITVPPELKRIAVQFDHDVETVTFDCPRYWDGLDMSKMGIYINYIRSDRAYGCYRAENVTVDETDENIMHFTWTISLNVTQVKGEIKFLICVRKADEEGNELNHWNSELCKDMYVSEGMECGEIILPQYPDVVEQWANDVQNTIDHCEEEVGATIDKAKTDIQTTIDQCTDTVDAAVSKAKDDVQATIDILLNARDAGELNGATFTPSVTDDGDLSWTNDRNFANPQPVNIHGATFTPSISEDGTLRWTNDKGLPNPEPVNIRGAAGINAVVVSDTEPATGPVLWFDTSKVE